MTQLDWNPFDIASNEFLLELTHYYSYMEVMSDFVNKEKRKLLSEIEQTKKKIRSGKIKEDQIPVEVEYESYFVCQLSQFSNTLFTSFFIALYSHFETTAVRYCKRAVPEPKIEYIEHTIGCLKKGTDEKEQKELEELKQSITNIRRLRNCIVHNPGEKENCRDNQKEAIEFFIRRNSHLRIEHGVLPHRKLEFWHPCYSSQQEPKS